jgi:SNF2 family DNA or RNA helicase
MSICCKLLTEGVVEEKILALQKKKRKLADSVCGKGKKDSELLFDAETIEELFAGESSRGSKVNYQID